MPTINDGGSSESDETDVTVMPEISPPTPAVITLTPPARRRIAARKPADDISRSSSGMRTMGFMVVLTGMIGLLRYARARAGSFLPAPRDRPRPVRADGSDGHQCP